MIRGCLLACVGAGAAFAQGFSPARLPVELEAQAAGAASVVSAAWEGVPAREIGRGQTWAGGTAPGTAPTYLADYDFGFADIRGAVTARLGAKPALDELRDFVAAYLTDKKLNGDVRLASQVVAKKSGDCSEHAVLLAALGRSFGHRLRILVGFVLLRDPATGAVDAVGHMWNEARVGGTWRVTDATRLDASPAIEVYHVPVGVITDESESYRMGLLKLMNRMPAKVRILRTR